MAAPSYGQVIIKQIVVTNPPTYGQVIVVTTT